MDTKEIKQTVLANILKPLESLSEKIPSVYIGIIAVVGLLGFACLICFPVLIIIGIESIATIFIDNFTSNYETWVSISQWVSITLFSILVTYSHYFTKFSLPTGIQLSRGNVPELFNLIDELKADYKWIAIDRIIITDKYELDIVTTPKYVLPIWNTHTLKIGLAMMECLSPTHFKCMLARKLGQFSKHQNFLPNLLYQLRYDWQSHNEAFTENRSLGILPLALFFRIYAPFYKLISTYIARIDELNADLAALRVINDEEVLDTVQQNIIARHFIEKSYWPKVREVINKKPSANPAPFEKLYLTFKNVEGKQDVLNLLKLKYAIKPGYDNPMPSLKNQVLNIGHTKLIKPSINKTSAALELLGKNYKRVVALTDKLWLKNTASDWKAQATKVHRERALFKSLYNKAKLEKLSYKEMWQYTKLRRRLSGNKTTIPWQNLLLRRIPELATIK